MSIKIIIDNLENQLTEALKMAEYYHNKFREYETKVIVLKHGILELKEIAQIETIIEEDEKK